MDEEATDDNQHCIISKEAVDIMLTDSLKLQANQTAIMERMATNIVHLTELFQSTTETVSSKLDDLNENIIAMNNTMKESSDSLGSKMDQLIDTLNRRPEPPPTTTAGSTVPIDIETTVRKHNSLTEKIVRNEFLSNYYEELINEATPFAPPKFRTKVLKSTPERDLKHRRAQTTNTVKTEIALMQDRITDWRSQITKLNEEIELFLTHNETQRLDVTTRMHAFEPKFREQYERTNMTKLRAEYDREKTMNFEFLVSIQDESDDEEDYDLPPKNIRGQHRGRRGTNSNRGHPRRPGRK
jgi:hypothetical protein